VPRSREMGPRLVQCGLHRGLLLYQAASSSIQPFDHNRHGPKMGGSGCALVLGVAGSTSNTMSRRPRPTSIPSSILMHPAVWPQEKWTENWRGGSAPFWERCARSPSNTKSSGPRPSSIPSDFLIHAAIWPQRIWAENWGGRLCPFGSGGAGSPSNTMWPGSRPTCMPSFILIRPTVWPQCTNVTDRQDRQTTSDITGRTVLQTVAQK